MKISGRLSNPQASKYKCDLTITSDILISDNNGGGGGACYLVTVRMSVESASLWNMMIRETVGREGGYLNAWH